MENTVVQHLIKINLSGGIVSPGDLLDILILADKAKVKHVRFGNRQQLLFWVEGERLEDLKDAFLVADVSYEVNEDQYPNIISSYVTEEVFGPSNWLREGVYKDILNNFNHQPKLKINIIDHTQNLVPFFTGNLNFINSELSNFWHLHLRFPKTNVMYRWPVLVYSEDIPAIAKILEDKIIAITEYDQTGHGIDGNALFEEVDAENEFVKYKDDPSIPLQHTDFQLPYYEGFNKIGDKLWLGIYRRNEEFSVDFLKEVCEICAKTRIGQLYTTPWKSVIIKNISISDRKYWSQLLNKFRINVRHAANELNWQTEDVCDEALALKLHLVKRFEEADLRTYRLCFAIKTKPNTGLFGSVIIRKRNTRNEADEMLYEVLHTKNFNPNSKDFILFKEGATATELAESLMALCEHYYRLQSSLSLPALNEVKEVIVDETEVYQCIHCQSVYDELFGEEWNGLEPGVKFETLGTHRCSVCDSPKEDFVWIKLKKPAAAKTSRIPGTPDHFK